MKQQRNDDHEINQVKKISEQYKKLNDYTHTEINKLYCIIDDLDKRILQIQAQESYQSQYNLNARLDKVERQQMQLPISYDDVVDIKNELKKLKKQVKSEKEQTTQNSQKVEEISTQINYTLTDEPTTNDIKNLKTEVKKLKKHLNSYSPKLRHDPVSEECHAEKPRRTTNQVKPKRDIPKPKKQNKDSLIANDLTKSLNKVEKQTECNTDQINVIKSKVKEAIDNSCEVQNKMEKILSDFSQLQSHSINLDTEINHIQIKVKRLSKKVKDLHPSSIDQEMDEKNGKVTEKPISDKIKIGHKKKAKHNKHTENNEKNARKRESEN